MTTVEATTAMDDTDEAPAAGSADSRATLVAYLVAIHAAVVRLATVPTDDDDAMQVDDIADEVQQHGDDDKTTSTDPALLIEQIARLLLKACQLSTLAASTSNLPALPIIFGPHDEAFREYLDESQHYQYRRIDYVRMLLRAMAPIAIDVVAQVCNMVQRQLQRRASTNKTQQSTATTTIHTTLAAVMLFAQWLPVASHITPLVSDLFSLMSFESPLVLVKDLLLMECSNDDNLQYQYQLLTIEAVHLICEYYCHRREHFVLVDFWDWTNIGDWFGEAPASTVDDAETIMQVDNDNANNEDDALANVSVVRWFAIRVSARILKLRACLLGKYYKLHNVDQELVPWVMHPFDADHEFVEAQSLTLHGRAQFWRLPELVLPTLDAVRRDVPLHPYLVHLGRGLVFCKNGVIRDDDDKLSQISTAAAIRNDAKDGSGQQQRLVMTPTTADNIASIGVAMALKEPPPILVAGPRGSGKSSLVRELARLFCSDDGAGTFQHDAHLLEIHVDDETDTKTLVGSYTTSDIPGEFEWRPGALTVAVRTGKWVLMEDVDCVPQEVQASLVQLLESRLLPLGNGKVERCHPSFRLFGTITSFSDTLPSSAGAVRDRALGGKRLLNPDLWRVVQIQPLPSSELNVICRSLYPNIPEKIAESVMKVFQSIDQSGRSHANEIEAPRIRIDQQPSVRDLFKVFSRIRRGIAFEKDTQYATEAQRTLCMAEAVDVFVAAAPDGEMRRDFVRHIAAPSFAITADLGLRYVETRCPTLELLDTCTMIGRCRLEVPRNSVRRKHAATFATTDYTLRLMEAIGICIQSNEPVLLVGETGCGKTTVLQQLAALCGRQLAVQNLSLQTDSNDILGGYRPLEMRLVAAKLYNDFVDLFVATFSRKQNAEFLQFASQALKKHNWNHLSQCFRRASKLGLGKMKSADTEKTDLRAWTEFHDKVERFEQQRLAADAGLAFVFTEGALVDAVRTGKWILLDEINLASSENLMRICGLLDDSSSSLTLTERGDSVALARHPDFRLFAAMNPATDTGKKDLNATIRSRFTEVYVGETLDPIELRRICVQYVSDILPRSEAPLHHCDMIIAIVDIYLKLRSLAAGTLVDGSGQRPRYTLRTLTRALIASRTLVKHQKLPLVRALYEGFELAFEGPLDSASTKAVRKVLRTFLVAEAGADLADHPGRRPGKEAEYELLPPFWLKKGPFDCVDWSITSAVQHRMFILTPSTKINLRRLSRAVAAGPWPILLEGPTSAGKTTLVEYLGSRLGHAVTRINNHEHTDIQEYIGGFVSSPTGSLVFQDGLLVRALRLGEWVILDELNLAPTDVLEALNRLLDDNRELYIPETNETVIPHESFRLFATQNPSGAYGGRKQLSRAFRNRFVELHMGDIASAEMTQILVEKCSCAPSQAALLVAVMDQLRLRRRKSGVFLGRDGFITPRDLLRWANRSVGSKLDMSREGYMLLAERLRTPDEKQCVKEEMEKVLKVQIEIDSVYNDESSKSHERLRTTVKSSSESCIANIALTKSLKRLVALVSRCIEHNEPVLLVGETGCGKTTVVQLLSVVLGKRLHTVSCHATTETADLLGGLRPVRGRSLLFDEILKKSRALVHALMAKGTMIGITIPTLLQQTANYSTADPDHDGCKRSSSMQEISRFLDEVSACGSLKDQHRDSKRLKLESGQVSPASGTNEAVICGAIASSIVAIKELICRYNSLFEWSDGPLVEAMKQGDFLLLDEVSLADDAVLERLNSVLEPSQSLVLAEKGVSGLSENPTITAAAGFHVFATMNPGGDFGKRELSPALRNRFTEIWVPSVDDWDDTRIILLRAMNAITSEHPLIIPRMLDYARHFNDTLCGALYPTLVLSLRDLLSWASFLVTTLSFKNENTFNCWDAYQHGAFLMHLDGLGLGSGMSLHGSAEVKTQAELYLRSQIPPVPIPSPGQEAKCGPFLLDRDCFGCPPFLIRLGPYPPSSSGFLFETPTTSVNANRILRALQLTKPVLLEGSPGIGKTTIIQALAAASGHRLVRINLSEQTDLADLVGQDLPAPPEAGADANRPSFRWYDGVLLTAIKAGDWVLLDEINLAQQTVLEGLNSCLDHRSNIYIPELGREIACPATFRVFAAQNPIAQGGGRKGLPKSFLNRFTKVYMDELTDDDMTLIAHSRFPAINVSLLDKMIAFGNQVCCEVENGAIGRLGSPWEVNLRDLFRWGQLLADYPDQKGTNCARFARELYVQRFRDKQDRDIVLSRYESLFLSPIACKVPKLEATASSVKIGTVTLCRSADGLSPLEPETVDSRVPFSMRESIEATARCVSMNWPCLLVTGHERNATRIVNVLAEFTGTGVVEVALNSASDVSELVGGFEQVDDQHRIWEALNSVRNFGLKYLMTVPDVAKTWPCLLQKKWKEIDTDEVIGLVALLRANDIFDKAYGVALAEIELVLKAHQKEADRLTRPKGAFAWKDGPLTRAMVEGQWIHLRGANLCPSTVLDRLNSICEPNGSLLLAEGGNDRVVKRHPAFRIFLSYDPDRGEVSKAMRNRCVELFLDILPSPCVGDLYDEVWDSCLRDAGAVVSIVRKCASKENSFDSSETASGSGMLVAALCERGYTSDVIRASTTMALPNVLGSRRTVNESCLALTSTRALVARPAVETAISDGRLIRSLLTWSKQHPEIHFLGIHKFEDFGRQLKCNTLDKLYNEICPSSSASIDVLLLRDHLLILFLNRSTLNDIRLTAQFLGNIHSAFGAAARFLSNQLLRQTGAWSGYYSTGEPTREALETISEIIEQPGHISPMEISQLRRLPQRALEARDLECIIQQGLVPNERLSVLSASVLISVGMLEETVLGCSLTASFYPFLKAFDKAVAPLLLHATPGDIAQVAINLCIQRDQLWHIARDTLINSRISEVFQFDEAELVLQWTAFRRVLTELSDLMAEAHHAYFATKEWRRLEALVDALDAAIYERQGLIAASLLDAATKPLVPRTADSWSTTKLLRDLIDSYSMNEWLDCDRPVRLEELVLKRHAYLFVTAEMRRDLVTTVCTIFLSSTDQIPALKGFSVAAAVRELVRQWNEAAVSFKQMLDRAQVDRNIITPENMTGVICEMTDEEEISYNMVESLLLERFADLQLTPLAEYYCEVVERHYVREVARFLASGEEIDWTELRGLVSFANVHTRWNGQLHQTLLWASEIESKELLSKLMLSLSSASLQRCWSGSAQLFSRITWDLRLPSPISHTEELPERASLATMSHNHDRTMIPAATVYQLLCNEFRRTSPASKGGKFGTVENQQTRRKQSQTLMKMLCCLDRSVVCHGPWEINLQLIDILTAMGDGFSDEAREVIVQALSQRAGMSGLDIEQLRGMITSRILNVVQVSCILVPLLECLQRLWSNATISNYRSVDYAKARTYLGIFRFHLLLPDSPLDPCRKPRAAVSTIDRRMNALRVELSAIRLDGVFVDCDQSPDREHGRRLLDEGERLIGHRKHQENRVFERPKDAVPFVGLYREVRDFAYQVMQADKVISFLTLDGEDAISRVNLAKLEHFCSTTTAFCKRLTRQYFAYEDVVVPLVDCLGSIMFGLSILANLLQEKATEAIRAQLQLISFTRFPMSDKVVEFPVLDASYRHIAGVALLARCGVQHKLQKSTALSIWYEIVDGILAGGRLESEQNDAEDADSEEGYRQHFPDFREEYNAVPEVDKDSNDNEVHVHESDDSTLLLQDEHIVIMCDMHERTFSHEFVDDSFRIEAFRLSFEASCKIYGRQGESLLSEMPILNSGYAMALSFFDIEEGQPVNSQQLPSIPAGFYRAANPKESARASPVLTMLMARLTVLCTAFSDNEILLAIIRVTDQIRKFDIYTVPLAKVMVGLELILKHAQDWEQHASIRVKIGKSLQLLRQLVSSWRKLQLECWSSLLKSRDTMYSRRAQLHWASLHAMLRPPSLPLAMGPSPMSCLPPWTQSNRARARTNLESRPEVVAIIKALDTFVLTSPLGQFSQRLRMLKSFALQLRTEESHHSLDDGRLALARSVSSLFVYYRQFLPVMSNKLRDMRRPIEDKLADEVKLAKWDEQSYYAALDSVERNYKNLMRIMNDYDTVLNTPVTELLEIELSCGVGNDAADAAATKIPNKSVFFSTLYQENVTECRAPSSVLHDDAKIQSWTWENIAALSVGGSCFADQIEHYTKKMLSFRRSSRRTSNYRSTLDVTDLSSAIFERIESLRADKTTRPMKERALLDLLKELKEQGYAESKWSTPVQVASLSELLQLPTLTFAKNTHDYADATVLESAEMYYQRSVAELGRLRGEVGLFGSRHLTLRQLNMMLAFADSGLFMLVQQRCTLSLNLSANDQLRKLLNSFPHRMTTLPTGQRLLRNHVSSFNHQCDLLLENLRQHRLLLHRTKSLFTGEDASVSMDELLERIEAAITEREKRKPCKLLIITAECLAEVSRDRLSLNAFADFLRSHLAVCGGLLPVDAIHATLTILDEAIAAAMFCSTAVTPQQDSFKVNEPQAFVDCVSNAVKAAVLAVQPTVTITEVEDASTSSIWSHHSLLLEKASATNVIQLNDKAMDVLSALTDILDCSRHSESIQFICTNVAADLGLLLGLTFDLLDQFLVEMVSFYRATAKLQYILLRIFRVLVAKGFCSDTIDEKESEGDGTSGMDFEENDGTGMGTGDGKIDVTDQIENEEQLLGLKGDEDQTPQHDTSKELDKEEAEKGMEMTNEFEGELFDVPDADDRQDPNNDDDEGEELEREMGDGEGQNDRVVDEKLWGDSDDEESKTGEDKFEKDSKVNGGAAGEEMATKDDDSVDEKPANEENGEGRNTEHEELTENNDLGDDAINDDRDEKYEESHGVPVRQDEEKEEEKQLELEGDIELDDRDDEASETGGTPDEADEHDKEHDSHDEPCDPNMLQPAVDEGTSEAENEDDIETEPPSAASAVQALEEEDEHPDDSPDNPEPELEREPDRRVEPNRGEAQHGLGVQSQEGQDAVDHCLDDVIEGQGENEGEQSQENEGAGDSETNPSGKSDGGGSGSQGQAIADGNDTRAKRSGEDEMPNPLRHPGDASRYLHRKLNIIDSQSADNETEETRYMDLDNTETNHEGEFEYGNSEDRLQALAEIEENEEVGQLDEPHQEQTVLPLPDEAKSKEVEHTKDLSSQSQIRQNSRPTSYPSQQRDETPDDTDAMDEDSVSIADNLEEMELDDEDAIETDDLQLQTVEPTGNVVVSDTSLLQRDLDHDTNVHRPKIQGDDAQLAGLSSAEESIARRHWNELQSETYGLSRRLCEKLRLVMEPLVASKLRGDYRTGKRINMKRVIGYIASGYRKDKIWLRRTKPAKRDYRVLIAVDDSESMRKSGAGEMALKALATLTVGMSQLEIGEMGVASFGNEMNLIHSFDQPFTSDSGPNIVGNFRFEQQRTRTALCVESAMMALESHGAQASMQLVFMVSDGRIERDSRAALRRLNRELTERNILLAMIIVEGENKKDSILNMKEVTFDKGKPVVKPFMEDYPFPYYIVVEDMQSLPEVLGDALRQWFEMLAGLQGN